MQVELERLRSLDSRMVEWDRLSRTVGEGQMRFAERNEMLILWEYWKGVRYLLEWGAARGEWMKSQTFRSGVERLRYWSGKIAFLFEGWRGTADATGVMVGFDVVRSVKMMRRVMMLYETALVKRLGRPDSGEDEGL